MRTIKLGVTITDAAVDETTTPIFCAPVTRDPRCPGCGRDGRYRDTVTRPLTDLPVAGYPAGAEGGRTPLPVRHRRLWAGGVQSGSGHAGCTTGVDNAAVRPVRVAPVDD
jgi:hypothetical protein